MTNYFEGIITLDELKKTYKKLALKNHPDRGGDVEVMKAINAEYDEKVKYIKAHGENVKEADFEAADRFKEVLDKIIGFDINIEICGAWVWVSGKTYPVKEQLKEANFSWAGKKKKWYWKPAGYTKRGKSEWSMEQIRDTYGSKKISNRSSKTRYIA